MGLALMRRAAPLGLRWPIVAWPRRQVATAAVAPAAVLPGVLLTGGRRGKALAACPLLGAAAGGFSLANGGLWCLVHKHRRPDDSDGGRGSGGNERGAGHREAEGQEKTVEELCFGGW